MYRYCFIVFLLIFLGGCAHKQLQTPPTKTQYIIDAILVKAALLESQGFYELAAKEYAKAYSYTQDEKLLYKELENLLYAKKYNEALPIVKLAIEKDPKNYRLYEILASLYYQQNDFQKAIETIKKAIMLHRSAKNLEFLANIYMQQKRYDLALKYYKSAYTQEPKASTINSIAYIMYFYLDKKRDAIAYLETHIRLYGCQKSVCTTLASLYGLRNDIPGLISIYERLYNKYKDQLYAKKVMEFYIYQHDYQNAIVWAKRAKELPTLLNLYRITKNYKAAYNLAMKLFKESKDHSYLAQAAMFEYEMAKKKTPKLLKDVVAKFEKAIQHTKDPVYLNYYGYLLIEHDLDIKKGIKLVKEALKQEPDSGYYLDSLAWGYYKIGKCYEALNIIKRVYFDMGLKDPEVELHLKKIQECAKKERD
ncbi:lipopolysaccharide assembly protein LapB [Nitratiruptor sp. YY09-18]|uniref:tetratricopeptide repeat protein n=1 Tax=Nitratiruptor sp. YY09-18 TaxID=2724901 RepID=UPI0019156E2F|nr:tetratricopeptide repeat protein [Nitratiruptor sp. YY09-18]BCD68090.1 hypothetical protein NitYY0918_C1001 [Nitratiruptor sp. YY09-18]